VYVSINTLLENFAGRDMHGSDQIAGREYKRGGI
jgi:hypothetical protein